MNKRILIISLCVMILPGMILFSLFSMDILNNSMLIEFLAKVVGATTVIAVCGVLYSFGLLKRKK